MRVTISSETALDRSLFASSLLVKKLSGASIGVSFAQTAAVAHGDHRNLLLALLPGVNKALTLFG